MKRTEFEGILTVARKMGEKLDAVEKALDIYLEDFFEPIQGVYNVLEASTKTRWDDATWDAIFDYNKSIPDIMALIEKNVIEDRKYTGEKEIKIFDEE